MNPKARSALVTVTVLSALSTPVALATSAGAIVSPSGTYCQTYHRKPFIGGATSRQASQVMGSNADKAKYVTSLVVEVDWATLEPSKGVYDFSHIDDRYCVGSS